MRVFRLTKKAFSQTLSGKGAALAGGRWNSPGTELVYTAANRALALVEVLVHLPPNLQPSDYVMMEIDVPDSLIVAEINPEMLPISWDVFPPLPGSQKLGDDFVRSNSACILKAPSAIVKGDSNFLINPYHPDFSQIQIVAVQDFGFDMRLR